MTFPKTIGNHCWSTIPGLKITGKILKNNFEHTVPSVSSVPVVSIMCVTMAHFYCVTTFWHAACPILKSLFLKFLSLKRTCRHGYCQNWHAYCLIIGVKINPIKNNIPTVNAVNPVFPPAAIPVIESK